MDIREATIEDIPAIIDLLKLSLGESLMPKSEGYWRWKHVDNPFGPSPVLLCWEGQVLVGVRAFMRWQWTWQGRLYNAVRAVDTATHPQFQGKGIFKKLTLGLVKECTNAGVDFVFNTPNKQSKPGYLKMGWIEAGKLPIRVRVDRPIAMIKNLVSNSKAGSDNPPDSHISLDQLQQFSEGFRHREQGLITNISLQYLKWRYIDVPVTKYVGIGGVENDVSDFVIGRIKRTALGREFRITDVFLKKEYPQTKFLQLFDNYKKTLGVDYSTLSGVRSFDARVLGKSSIHLPVGPPVTIRNLGMNNLDTLKRFTNWSPSLGDLELF